MKFHFGDVIENTYPAAIAQGMVIAPVVRVPANDDWWIMILRDAEGTWRPGEMVTASPGEAVTMLECRHPEDE